MPRAMAECASDGEVMAGAVAVGVDRDDGPTLGLYRPGATWPGVGWDMHGLRLKEFVWTAAEWATLPESLRPAAAQRHPSGAWTLVVLAGSGD